MDSIPRAHPRRKKPFLIGVAGGVSSGKSSVCNKIVEQLAQLNNEHKKQIMIISFDSFYRHLTPDEQMKAQRGEHNFDHPSSFDDELGYKTLTDIIHGKEVDLQIYDNKTFGFKNDTLHIKPGENAPDVLIVEGILVFYYPKIRDLFQMKLFVDCDADTRLSRRVLRDMCEYNRDLEQILSYYTKSVKPAFEEFCLPTKKYADVIIPRGAENSVAINLIVQHIDDLLNHNMGHSNGLASGSASLLTNGGGVQRPGTTAVDMPTTPKASNNNKRRSNNSNSSNTAVCNASPVSINTNANSASPSTPQSSGATEQSPSGTPNSKRNDHTQRPH